MKIIKKEKNKARKEHICYFSKKIIEKGEYYFIYVIRFNGKLKNIKRKLDLNFINRFKVIIFKWICS